MYDYQPPPRPTRLYCTARLHGLGSQPSGADALVIGAVGRRPCAVRRAPLLSHERPPSPIPHPPPTTREMPPKPKPASAPAGVRHPRVLRSGRLAGRGGAAEGSADAQGSALEGGARSREEQQQQQQQEEEEEEEEGAEAEEPEPEGGIIRHLPLGTGTGRSSREHEHGRGRELGGVEVLQEEEEQGEEDDDHGHDHDHDAPPRKRRKVSQQAGPSTPRSARPLARPGQGQDGREPAGSSAGGVCVPSLSICVPLRPARPSTDALCRLGLGLATAIFRTPSSPPLPSPPRSPTLTHTNHPPRAQHLLRTIHHLAAQQYTAQGLMVNAPRIARRQRRGKWDAGEKGAGAESGEGEEEEPKHRKYAQSEKVKDMYRSLDGSALTMLGEPVTHSLRGVRLTQPARDPPARAHQARDDAEGLMKVHTTLRNNECTIHTGNERGKGTMY
ncbi:hypothetical protein CALCODRAFT_86117 [Calocera cornea HHB12733]|uniref:Uncharacterized protein n=1 Tax=Calocera cornea HHB12733 TaxID=1353952 RepID=A0A165IPV7_9BASI|nr:hypothetical protein CALCODRAFT_86117 [Calocera cornea HHB12733]